MNCFTVLKLLSFWLHFEFKVKNYLKICKKICIIILRTLFFLFRDNGNDKNCIWFMSHSKSTKWTKLISSLYSCRFWKMRRNEHNMTRFLFYICSINYWLPASSTCLKVSAEVVMCYTLFHALLIFIELIRLISILCNGRKKDCLPVCCGGLKTYFLLNFGWNFCLSRFWFI